MLKARGDTAGSAQWGAATKGAPLAMHIKEMHEIAAKLKVNIAWDWEACRSQEGYYAVKVNSYQPVA